jgi:hypothetical protein
MERKHSPGVFSFRQMQSFHVNLGVDSRYSRGMPRIGAFQEAVRGSAVL